MPHPTLLYCRHAVENRPFGLEIPNSSGSDTIFVLEGKLAFIDCNQSIKTCLFYIILGGVYLGMDGRW